MTHDYKADRIRLEAVLDARNADRGIAPPLTGFSKQLFDCFKSGDVETQLHQLANLENNLRRRTS